MYEAETRPVIVSQAHMVRGAAGAETDGLAVVWGGEVGFSQDRRVVAEGWIVPADGGKPAHVAASGLAPRSDHVAVSVGGEVLIWGGLDGEGEVLRDGAVLDPKTNIWRDIAPAPWGVASARAIVDRRHLLVGAGWRERNRPNTVLLDYDFVADRWETIALELPAMADWVLVDDMIAVSRDPNGQDLSLHRLDRRGEALAEPITLSTDLGVADYLGLVRHREGVVVAASDRDQTVVWLVAAAGEIVERVTMDASAFSPALRVDTGGGVMSSENGMWFSFQERRVQTLAFDGLEPGSTWRLSTCRTATTWVPFGQRRFLHYGGQACAGDVPEDSGGPLAVVLLREEP